LLLLLLLWLDAVVVGVGMPGDWSCPGVPGNPLVRGEAAVLAGSAAAPLAAPATCECFKLGGDAGILGGDAEPGHLGDLALATSGLTGWWPPVSDCEPGGKWVFIGPFETWNETQKQVVQKMFVFASS
jgi:hypothetical protein